MLKRAITRALLAAMLCIIGGLSCSNQAWGGTARFTLHEIDIAHAVGAIQHFTGQSILLGNDVKGKISLVSPMMVDAHGAVTLLRNAVRAHGLQADIDAQGGIVIRRRTPEFHGKPLKDNGFATRSYLLHYRSAAEVSAHIRPLLSSQGSLGAAGAYTLVVEDVARVHRDVERLLMVADVDDKSTTPVSSWRGVRIDAWMMRDGLTAPSLAEIRKGHSAAQMTVQENRVGTLYWPAWQDMPGRRLLVQPLEVHNDRTLLRIVQESLRSTIATPGEQVLPVVEWVADSTMTVAMGQVVTLAHSNTNGGQVWTLLLHVTAANDVHNANLEADARLIPMEAVLQPTSQECPHKSLDGIRCMREPFTSTEVNWELQLAPMLARHF